MTGTEILALYYEADKLRDRYLELRDAKSNGYCSKMTIPQIFEYDKQISTAYNDMKAEYDRIDKLLV